MPPTLSTFEKALYYERVLRSIADGIPFRGVEDPQEIARKVIDRDWPDAPPTIEKVK